MADELPIPIEIPWQLASTTQPFGAGQPEETAISLFTFLPDPELTADDFPGQQLVFLKVTTTISPAEFPAGAGSPVASALGEGVPCYHAQLDLTVRLEDGQLGTIRPYFHAAAPLRREMVQSGVVGGEAYEGESNHQAVGRSSSQLHETSKSTSSTMGFSAGGSFLGFGASASFSTTDVAGRRTVDQVVDSTSRDASQERRELVSHMTRVENVLTLLSTKYLGTPYLRFSLSPRPLEQLSVDPSDPSLWFGQLLQRRSSGIEGVQEFTTVVVVPKGEDFCITASLRRVCVLDDDPPVEPDFSDTFTFNQDLWRLYDYVLHTYPIGTPVDDLDVDMRYGSGALGDGMRPVIDTWWIGADGRMIAEVVATNGKAPQIPGLVRAEANYKTFTELWLETLRDEFERACARSPLEDGILLGETRTLDTCFTFNAPGGLGVLNSQSSVTAFRPVRIRPGDLLGGPPMAATSMALPVRSRALETVVRWNNLSARLRNALDNPPGTKPPKPGRFDDPRMVRTLLRRWAKLRPEDPRNLSLAELGKEFGIDRQAMAALKSARIGDLRGLAKTLLAAPLIDRYNRSIPPAPRQRGKAARDRAAVPREPIDIGIDAKLAAAIERALGKALLAPLDERAEG
jgi:hypothetical protein